MTLRAVDPTERAPRRKKPLTIVQAATLGTHHDMLTALQHRLAAAMEDPNAHPRDLAPLGRQLLEINQQLEALNAAGPAEDPIGKAAATPTNPGKPSNSPFCFLRRECKSPRA